MAEAGSKRSAHGSGDTTAISTCLASSKSSMVYFSDASNSSCLGKEKSACVYAFVFQNLVFKYA